MIVEQVTPRILHWLALGVCFELQNWRDKRLDRGLYSAVGDTSGWNHFKKKKSNTFRECRSYRPQRTKEKKKNAMSV
jgi:hypothetical protein